MNDLEDKEFPPYLTDGEHSKLDHFIERARQDLAITARDAIDWRWQVLRDQLETVVIDILENREAA